MTALDNGAKEYCKHGHNIAEVGRNKGGTCNRCATRYVQEWRARERAAGRTGQFRKPPEEPHDYYVRFYYGITGDEYNAMLAQQNGCCAICQTPPTESRRLCVDHCHTTGAVRGLLCDRCNVGIGKFNDDPALVAVALEYLTKNNE